MIKLSNGKYVNGIVYIEKTYMSLINGLTVEITEEDYEILKNKLKCPRESKHNTIFSCPECGE